MRPMCLFICCVATLAYCVPTVSAGSEHLLFHQLHDGIVAVTAAYSAHRSANGHDTTFPRSISSLLDSFPIQELNFTLTRGRWREEWCGSDHLAVSILVRAGSFTVSRYDVPIVTCGQTRVATSRVLHCRVFNMQGCWSRPDSSSRRNPFGGMAFEHHIHQRAHYVEWSDKRLVRPAMHISEHARTSSDVRNVLFVRSWQQDSSCDIRSPQPRGCMH